MSNMTDKGKLFGIVILAGLFIFAILFLWMFGLGIGFGGTTETWSHFGSFFGGVLGPLLSFFSFLAIIYTVHLQSKSNVEQAVANDHMARATKLSEEISKANLEEQKVQFEMSVQNEIQKRILDISIHTFNELENAGCDAALDLISKNENEDPTLGVYYNTFNWRVKSAAIVLAKYKDELNNDSSLLIDPILERSIGQINNFLTAIQPGKLVFENQHEIPYAIEELETAETSLSDTLKELREKHNLK